MKRNNKNKIISLDKFIFKALYDPKIGYYSKKKSFGINGDFVTSPNISILFSEIILIWIISFWENLKKPKKINIIEMGAGNGEMIYQIIKSSKIFPQFFKSCNFLIRSVTVGIEILRLFAILLADILPSCCRIFNIFLSILSIFINI